MNSLANEYRGKAHEAHVTELETHDPFLRRAYSKLARHWNEVADRVEREETAGSRPSSRIPKRETSSTF
jgi:hypothetical protein